MPLQVPVRFISARLGRPPPRRHRPAKEKPTQPRRKQKDGESGPAQTLPRLIRLSVSLFFDLLYDLALRLLTRTFQVLQRHALLDFRLEPRRPDAQLLKPQGVYVGCSAQGMGNWFGPIAWLLGIAWSGLFRSQTMKTPA